ncbi:hypothetical protein NPIL_98411, partial [Nephila pilipes]
PQDTKQKHVKHLSKPLEQYLNANRGSELAALAVPENLWHFCLNYWDKIIGSLINSARLEFPSIQESYRSNKIIRKNLQKVPLGGKHPTTTKECQAG